MRHCVGVGLVRLFLLQLALNEPFFGVALPPGVAARRGGDGGDGGDDVDDDDDRTG